MQPSVEAKPTLSWMGQYAGKLGARYTSFVTAFRYALDIEDALADDWCLIETGSIRTINNWQGDGGGTIVLGQFAHQQNRVLHTVDISADATSVAKHATQQWRENVECITGDSVEYLRGVDFPVGFLYLDSMDCLNAVERARQHQCEELMAIWPNLVPGAVVLLDDNPGKTDKTKAFLASMGAQVFVDALQSGWRIQRG